MRRVEEVARCTHLVLEDRVVRTEKFLCAMAYGVPVVTRQWIIDSIAQGKVLREHSCHSAPFPVLMTTASNRQLPAHQRIRSSRKQSWLRYRRSPSACKSDRKELFKGHTFYISKHAKRDFSLLEKVIKAAGGQVELELSALPSFILTFCTFQAQNSLPPLRSVEDHSDDRHVISCLEDKYGWQAPAAQGIPIYLDELIIKSILRQQFEPNKHRILNHKRLGDSA
jgi:hypothetical protein